MTPPFTLGLNFIMHHLAMYPEYQERCRAEALNVLAGRESASFRYSYFHTLDPGNELWWGSHYIKLWGHITMSQWEGHITSSKGSGSHDVEEGMGVRRHWGRGWGHMTSSKWCGSRDIEWVAHSDWDLALRTFVYAEVLAGFAFTDHPIQFQPGWLKLWSV